MLCQEIEQQLSLIDCAPQMALDVREVAYYFKNLCSMRATKQESGLQDDLFHPYGQHLLHRRGKIWASLFDKGKFQPFGT